MTETKRWQVDIYIDEHGSMTRAEARLRNPDKTEVFGVGTARRNPIDPNVPEIGDELAVARALSNLAHVLLDAAVEDIQAITHQPARLKS